MGTSRVAGALCAVLLSFITLSSHATLVGRDLDGNLATFEAYYDADLDITWLADANYAKTSGYSPSGLMPWAAADNWAANLSIVDAVNNITYNNWRLPTTLIPDVSCSNSSGYNCTSSEMGHLFYAELGGTAGQSILTSADPDLAKFTNLQPYFYWSLTQYDDLNAWLFYMDFGYQDKDDFTNGGYAWAVSSGDVGASAVPVPAAAWLFASGSLGLVGIARQRRSA